MTFGSDQDRARLEDLSALVDGESADAGTACSSWHGDARLRSAWHAYQLIGDVLRSEDLASDPSRDAVFLQRLRLRLAQEPVVFAPGATADPTPGAWTAARAASPRRVSRWPWRSASAIAAGFVAVAGVYTFMQPAAQRSSREPALATAPSTEGVPSQAPMLASVEVPAAMPGPGAGEASGKLLRDARLDAYLAAHEQFAGSTALGMPSSFLRSATVSAPGR